MNNKPKSKFPHSMEKLFRPGYYWGLNAAGEPIEFKTFGAWMRGMLSTDDEHSDIWRDRKRVVAHTKIGRSNVCTDFIPINMNWFSEGPPILWETMVFGGKLNEYQQRCSGGRKEAEAMHAKVCAKVRAALKSKPKKKKL